MSGIDYKKKYLETEKKYLKYKKKYLNTKSQIGGVDFDELKFTHYINDAKKDAHLNAYKLLKKLENHQKVNHQHIQLVTSESVTGGLLWSTLVNIPFWGKYKYGCFGVYDSNAKRNFIGVTEPDVYTHRCTKQMAIGSLLNSNGTLAISISGNAMPYSNEKERVGEVFIGVAGYVKDGPNSYKIRVKTQVFNFCKQAENSMEDKMPQLCSKWLTYQIDEPTLRDYVYTLKKENDKCKADLDRSELVDPDLVRQSSVPVDESWEKQIKIQGYADLKNQKLIDGFNDFELTDQLQEYIRNKVVAKACKMAEEFITNTIIRPSFVNHPEWENWADKTASDALNTMIRDITDRCAIANCVVLEDHPIPNEVLRNRLTNTSITEIQNITGNEDKTRIVGDQTSTNVIDLATIN